MNVLRSISSRRRVDGVEIDAAIQDEHAVNLISTQAATQSPYCGRDARLAKACAVDMPEHISDMFVERIEASCGVIVDFEQFSAIARVCVDCRGTARDCRDAWHLLEPGRPDAVVERGWLRIAPQLVLPNRSSFSLEDVLESVVETVSIDLTPETPEKTGTYDHPSLRKCELRPRGCSACALVVAFNVDVRRLLSRLCAWRHFSL